MSAPLGPYVLYAPAAQTAPVVFASAHSGRHYPADFINSARLDPLALRRSEDSFVEELFADAPGLGAPLLAATFPRAWCDVNREAWELDPTMFSDKLPSWVNTGSMRVHAGLGTIARVVSSGEAIYRHKLDFAEAERRVRECWIPFHDALERLVAATLDRFGVCLLIDCHSMPSIGPHRAALRQADFVLGDAHGTSCTAGATTRMEAILRGFGYSVARNDPYAGGHITRHYGRPRHGVHALQLEIARDLYMNETKIEKHTGFATLQRDLRSFTDTVVGGAPALLAG